MASFFSDSVTPSKLTFDTRTSTQTRFITQHRTHIGFDIFFRFFGHNNQTKCTCVLNDYCVCVDCWRGDNCCVPLLCFQKGVLTSRSNEWQMTSTWITKLDIATCHSHTFRLANAHTHACIAYANFPFHSRTAFYVFFKKTMMADHIK